VLMGMGEILNEQKLKICNKGLTVERPISSYFVAIIDSVQEHESTLCVQFQFFIAVMISVDLYSLAFLSKACFATFRENPLFCLLH
jgi:hypothetical protein